MSNQLIPSVWQFYLKLRYLKSWILTGESLTFCDAKSKILQWIGPSVQFNLGGSVHGERANFTMLVLFCIDASVRQSTWIIRAVFTDYKSFAPSHRSELEISAKTCHNFFTVFLKNKSAPESRFFRRRMGLNLDWNRNEKCWKKYSFGIHRNRAGWIEP